MPRLPRRGHLLLKKKVFERGQLSLILGENPVLGQTKSFFSEAESAGFMDRILRRIFCSPFL